MKSSLGKWIVGLAFAAALLVGAVPALAAAGSGSPSASKGPGLPAAPSMQEGLKVKPSAMQIISVSHSFSPGKLPTLIQGKPSGKYSTPLHWKTWNAKKAVVDAYIYDGVDPGYPSTVTLSHPRMVQGQLVFTQLKGKGGKEVRASIYHQPDTPRGFLEWAPPGTH